MPVDVDRDYEVYGSYDIQDQDQDATYYFALKTNTINTIDKYTTFWMNTDGDPTTGKHVYGSVGADYFVEFLSLEQEAYALKPFLYTDGGVFVSGPLEHAFSADRRTVEFAVLAADINDTNIDIDIFMDINNADFLPKWYSMPPYTIKARQLPPRTDEKNKRVAVVFSSTTSMKFFSRKAYSQLYASMQHQVMMAGIPYDLIHVEDLTILENIMNYDALIFPYNANVQSALLDSIVSNLHDAVYHYGIGIITADNWFTNDENGTAIRPSAYQTMTQVLGLRRLGGGSSSNYSVKAITDSHPVMNGYAVNEQIMQYERAFYSSFGKAMESNADVTTLAIQEGDTVDLNLQNAILASETAGGARHVYFASIQLMGDGNLVWQALQWVVFGGQCPVGLKLGRQKSIFLARNDMDMSGFAEYLEIVHLALYENFLVPWKNSYNFVGTYFINVENAEESCVHTNWTKARPLYNDYIALGNEIGSHSYTHPFNLNSLTEIELHFEIVDAENRIKDEMMLATIGTAQPGAAESLEVNEYLDEFLLYFSGSYSGIGAGYPGAFGFLSPDFTMIHFAPNMVFDFTLIEYIPLRTAEEATGIWNSQYHAILKHASTPIVHWPWHDYGPTLLFYDRYTADMYEDTIALAYNDDTEFTTIMDMHERIRSFTESELVVSESGSVVTATVTSTNAGHFSLAIGCDSSQVIEKVEDWYAYSSDRVFLPTEGGSFAITVGLSADIQITRITSLPMRAELVSLIGDGAELAFTFDGLGTVTVELNNDEAANLAVQGADVTILTGATTLSLTFDSFGMHNGVIFLCSRFDSKELCSTNVKYCTWDEWDEECRSGMKSNM
jgi:hypothetical protein